MDVDALITRSEKGFTGQAGYTLSVLLSDFTLSRVLLSLSELASSLSGLASLS